MIDLLWRIAAGLAGLGVMGAATNLNVIRAGGYGSGDAALVITIAALVAVGIGYAAWAWKDGNRLGPIVLAACLLAGEAYWTFTNTDRELQARIAAEEPAARLNAKRAELRREVAEAKAAKKAADDAALTQAALPGCRQVCAVMLGNAKREAEAALTAKETALNALPEEKATDGLAAHLGVPQWRWDLIMALLRSAAVMGGSIAIALALHPRRKELAPAVTAAIPMPVRQLDARPVATLIQQRVPAAKGEVASWADIFLTYHRNKSPGDPSYTEREFGAVLKAICDYSDIPIEVRGNEAFCVGRRVISAKRLGHMTRKPT